MGEESSATKEDGKKPICKKGREGTTEATPASCEVYTNTNLQIA